MSYYVYEYNTQILDPNLQTLAVDEATALNFIIYIVFKQENIPLHIAISNKYRENGECLKATRSYNPGNYTLTTKRYFSNINDPNAMKVEYDIIYDSNIQNLISNGLANSFAFSDSITEVSDAEFNSVVDNLYP